MVFLLLAIVFPRRSTGKLAFKTAVLCLLIELLKLYHAPWMETVRALPFSRLLFGYAFSWSNLFCYGIGILLGAGAEIAIASRISADP
jgi:hypothetical protein